MRRKKLKLGKMTAEVRQEEGEEEEEEEGGRGRETSLSGQTDPEVLSSVYESPSSLKIELRLGI